MQIFLAVRRPGLLLADLDLRLYAADEKVEVPSLVVMSDASGLGDYRISGFPEDRPYTLTGSVDGNGFAESWGAVGTPRVIVLPIREHVASPAGVLGLELFREGISNGSALAVRELGDPGDYAVSGWPIEAGGATWVLSWTYEDKVGSVSWSEAVQVDTDRLDLPDRLLAAFTLAWRATTPPTPLTAMPHVAATGAGWRPANQEPFVELDLLMDRGEQWGTVGNRNYDLPGVVQISVHVRAGDGSELAGQLIRIAASKIDELGVRGLRCYGARSAYSLPAPLAGYYARGVDIPARYVGP